MNQLSDKIGAEDAQIVSNGIGRIAIGDLLRRSAQRFGEKIAIAEPGRSISYRDLDLGANRIANYLLAQGYPPGSRIATLCANSIDYVMVIFAINKAGFVWVPVNTMLAASDVGYILDHCSARMLVVDPDLCERPQLEPLLSQGAWHVTTSGGAAGSIGALSEACSASDPDVSIHERDVALIMYTSGTTAKAKGVMHCHLAVYITMLNNIGEWSVTRADNILVGVPLFHCAGHTMVTVLLTAGGTVHLRNGFDPVDGVATIAREGVTLTFALPMMYDALLKEAVRTRAELPSLRLCLYAMAPMPKPLLEQLIEGFCPTFALTTGQTEIYPMTAMFRPEQQLQRFGSYWGEAAMIDDLAIMDDAGNMVPPGGIGEIVHRGPNVMLGYFGDAEASREARKFGWHHTGDLGYLDPDGQLVFADRKKDLIKTGGENVPSVLVEEAMLRHPAVELAAAIGLPHPRWSEAIFVCVKLKEGAVLDEAELVDHAKQHLGGFQLPKGFAIIDQFPMTASGKCRKDELRRRYRETFQPAVPKA